MDLSKKLGEMEYDGLVTALEPPVVVGAGNIAKLSTAATLKRGTLLAKSKDTGLLSVLGTTASAGDTLTADCILCDDAEIGTTTDVTAAVYLFGCFDPQKVIVADNYTITEGDKDALRQKGIILKAAQPAL